jgi:Leucine-rich repeat (LRR) protein
MVIEAKHSGPTGESIRSTEWHYGMADPNVWAWKQPTSLRGILQSDTVTTVKNLHLYEGTAYLVVELSWFVSGGDINWTTTKTTCQLYAQTEGVSTEEILLNPKLRNIQTLKLSEFDRSVLANLENLESLDLSYTNVVDVSSLATLTNLKSLTLYRARLLDISTLPELKNLETLNLSDTNVVDVSALATLKNLTTLILRQTDVDVSALKQKLPKLKVIQ